MADGEFAGDPGGIIRAGWQIRSRGEQMRSTVTTRQVRLTVPGGTNAAWASGSVATAVTADWQVYLTQLAEKVDGHGGNLITAGTEYQATDAANAKSMR